MYIHFSQDNFLMFITCFVSSSYERVLKKTECDIPVKK